MVPAGVLCLSSPAFSPSSAPLSIVKAKSTRSASGRPFWAVQVTASSRQEDVESVSRHAFSTDEISSSPPSSSSSSSTSWIPRLASIAPFAVAASAAAVLTLHPFVVPDNAFAYIGGGPYGREVTRGQDLTGRDFSGLDLTGQDFKTSILRQANFKGAKLVGASFFDADLTGADFTDADLTAADFSLASAVKAKFTNAVLEGAQVTGNTSFRGSDITGADFTDVLFREDQKAYLCPVAKGENSVTGNVTRESLFCRD